MTLSDAAAVAGLSRATARRVLRTLAQLGYVVQDGRAFSLTPRILDLGFAYLSGQRLDRPRAADDGGAERASRRILLGAILQGNDIVYVARVPARRIMSAALSVGSRLPAFHTSLGRAQLGYLDERGDLAPTAVAAHRGLHAADHHRPAGACSIASAPTASRDFPSSTKSSSAACVRLAVPVLDRSGQAVGAINLSTHSTRTTRNEMREQFLPELSRIARANFA